MNYICQKSSLQGEIIIPPSKSHTLRAILFASMAKGVSIIDNYLKSPDAMAMVDACISMGAKIKIDETQLKIEGISGSPKTPSSVIDVGNSGQVLRFFSAMMALQSDYAVITGDFSIRHIRPMQPLIDGLNNLGGFCVSSKNDGFAPIIIRGPVKSGKVRLKGQDSQPVSALLMLAAFLKGKTEIIVDHPGETTWIDLTLHWLDKFGVEYHNDNYERYVINGLSNVYQGFNYTVPGDFSSVLFPVAAALITHSEISLLGIDMGDIQGDKKVIELFRSMGANIIFDSKNKKLSVGEFEALKGIEIEANDFIDAVPILAVIGCFSKGQTIIKNSGIARHKECDRISAITKELKKMGAFIKETDDGLIVENSKLKGCEVETYHDHRMVMALSVAGMVASGKTTIKNVKSVSKSYPTFYDDMKQLGAQIEA